MMSEWTWAEQPGPIKLGIKRASFYRVPPEQKAGEPLPVRVARGLGNIFEHSMSAGAVLSSADAVRMLRDGREEARLGDYKLASELLGRASNTGNERIKQIAQRIQERLVHKVTASKEFTFAPNGPRVVSLWPLGGLRITVASNFDEAAYYENYRRKVREGHREWLTNLDAHLPKRHAHRKLNLT